jgi:hypothetical protein
MISWLHGFGHLGEHHGESVKLLTLWLGNKTHTERKRLQSHSLLQGHATNELNTFLKIPPLRVSTTS